MFISHVPEKFQDDGGGNKKSSDADVPNWRLFTIANLRAILTTEEVIPQKVNPNVLKTKEDLVSTAIRFVSPSHFNHYKSCRLHNSDFSHPALSAITERLSKANSSGSPTLRTNYTDSLDSCASEAAKLQNDVSVSERDGIDIMDVLEKNRRNALLSSSKFRCGSGKLRKDNVEVMKNQLMACKNEEEPNLSPRKSRKGSGFSKLLNKRDNSKSEENNKGNEIKNDTKDCNKFYHRASYRNNDSRYQHKKEITGLERESVAYRVIERRRKSSSASFSSSTMSCSSKLREKTQKNRKLFGKEAVKIAENQRENDNNDLNFCSFLKLQTKYEKNSNGGVSIKARRRGSTKNEKKQNYIKEEKKETLLCDNTVPFISAILSESNEVTDAKERRKKKNLLALSDDNNLSPPYSAFTSPHSSAFIPSKDKELKNFVLDDFDEVKYEQECTIGKRNFWNFVNSCISTFFDDLKNLLDVRSKYREKDVIKRKKEEMMRKEKKKNYIKNINIEKEKVEIDTKNLKENILMKESKNIFSFPFLKLLSSIKGTGKKLFGVNTKSYLFFTFSNCFLKNISSIFFSLVLFICTIYLFLTCFFYLKPSLNSVPIFCSSDMLEVNAVIANCTACPPNAVCTGGEMRCLRKYTEAQGGETVVCVLDKEAVKRANALVKRIHSILSKRKGEYLCNELEEEEVVTKNFVLESEEDTFVEDSFLFSSSSYESHSSLYSLSLSPSSSSSTSVTIFAEENLKDAMTRRQIIESDEDIYRAMKSANVWANVWDDLINGDNARGYGINVKYNEKIQQLVYAYVGNNPIKSYKCQLKEFVLFYFWNLIFIIAAIILSLSLMAYIRRERLCRRLLYNIIAIKTTSDFNLGIITGLSIAQIRAYIIANPENRWECKAFCNYLSFLKIEHICDYLEKFDETFHSGERLNSYGLEKYYWVELGEFSSNFAWKNQVGCIDRIFTYFLDVCKTLISNFLEIFACARREAKHEFNFSLENNRSYKQGEVHSQDHPAESAGNKKK